MAISVAPNDSQEFLPLFAGDTEDAILERLRAWANEGLDPAADVDLWVDTREGGHFATTVTPCARELARLYDVAGTEVPMSGMVVWAWGSYLDDLALVWKIERLAATRAAGVVRFTGAEGTVIGAGTVVSVPPLEPDAPAPNYEVSEAGTIGAGGHVDLPVVAEEAGVAGNVAAKAVTASSTPLPGVTIENPEAIVGGTEPETDEALLERLLEEFGGKGGGTARDYRVWAKEHAGVGHATVVTAWAGPNTVLVIVTDPQGKPASAATIADLQGELDPVAGKAQGKAPAGAQVTVETAALLNVLAVARLDFEDGYSLDGAGGTIALRAVIERALTAYIDTIEPGGAVVLAQVLARIAVVPGVHDAGDVTLNGVAGNLAVAASPPKVPVLSSLTLTEGTP